MVLLRCVECGAPGLLDTANGALVCAACGSRFPRHRFKATPVLIGSKSELNVAEILGTDASLPDATPKPGAARSHWETGELTHLLRSCPGHELLIFGGGEGSDRRWLEDHGYAVTSFDIFPGDYTDFIADGHDLPFADNQFDIIASVAVFEHLHDPFQAAREIHRVLKPGGALLGSSAFLEPYHSHSYFHMSHLGLTEIFRRAGFSTVHILPGWSYHEALSGNFWLWNRFRWVRRITRPLNRLSYRAGLALWRLSFALQGRRVPDELALRFCGSLVFQAVK